MSCEEAGPSCAWLVTDATGPHMLAFPMDVDGGMDSRTVAEMLIPLRVGRFTVERLDTATLPLAPEPHVRGWAVAIDPGEAPTPGLH